MAQDAAEEVAEAVALVLVDGDLRDAAELVFDRIFDRDDVSRLAVDFADAVVEGRGLAAAGWAAGDDQAAVLVADRADAVFHVVRESQVPHVARGAALVQHAQHQLGPVHAGREAHAILDATIGEDARKVPVLHSIAPGDLHVARRANQAEGQFAHSLGQFDDGDHLAVDAHADVDGFLLGLKVDVGRAALAGQLQQQPHGVGTVAGA